MFKLSGQTMDNLYLLSQNQHYFLCDGNGKYKINLFFNFRHFAPICTHISKTIVRLC